MTISLCLIIKDEQDVLDRCLSSFCDIVDEIIIVDTGSKDNSINIAKKYTSKIYNYKWDNDFSAARNYSLSFAKCDYIMWVDADDYIENTQKTKILDLKKSNDYSIDIYYLLYDFDKNYLPFYRERIIKNNSNCKFKGKIHEAIIPFGKTKYEKITIKQFDKNKGLTKRNLNIYLSMKQENLNARDLYYFAKELYRHNEIKKAKEMFIKSLETKNGYYIDNIDCCYYLSIIYKNENNFKKALEILFDSFKYDLPKPHVLCEIGSLYLFNNEIEKAIFYYKLALNTKIDNNLFVHKDYLKYIPLIQLCVCYDRLKDYKKAYKYNEMANNIKNNPDIYYHNKKYLSKLIK